MILFTIRLNQKVVILIDCVRDKQWIKMGKLTMCVRDKHIGRTLWNSLSSKGVYKFCWSNIYMQSDRRTLNFGNISQILKPNLLPHFLTLLCKIPWLKPKPPCYYELRIETTVERRRYLTIPVETITKTRHLKITINKMAPLPGIVNWYCEHRNSCLSFSFRIFDLCL
jgi:hypothetical protein